MKRARGFTIIELIITIIIISILATIGTVSLMNVQRQARDNRRASDASAVAEALEKYFVRNGEYPSIPQMTSSNGSSVESLLGLQGINVLLAPGAASGTTNSWVSGVGTTPSATNSLLYSGNTDSTAACVSGSPSPGACIDFKIQYYNEQDGTTTVITSRHTSPTS